MSLAADGPSRLKNLAIPGLAAVVSLKLFAIGIAYPLGLRLRGDAYQYLRIASSFDSPAAALTYAGERTGGFPLFEFLILRLLGLFSSPVHALAWVDAIGLALLAIHFAAAWFFAAWAWRSSVVRSRNAMWLLFFFLATFPAMVGHTTAPVTDTLATDLVLGAVAALGAALRAPGRDRAGLLAILLAVLAGFCLGYAILVRPGNLVPVAGGLLAAGAAALLAPLAFPALAALPALAAGLRRAVLLVGIAAAGCLLTLAPYSARCGQKYGGVCLQSPKAFDPVPVAQIGLRGARTLWSKTSGAPAEIPTLPDDTLVRNYAQRCQLTSLVGVSDTSLTGCLLSRPLALPAYVLKKWIGLFDHFRFTPYLEDHTPPWLRLLSRAYSALAWTGFALCFVVLAQAARRGGRPEALPAAVPAAVPAAATGALPWAAGNPPLVLLAAYSALMLAQHTIIHVEERYSFPLLGLCALALLVSGEKAADRYRAAGWRGAAGLWRLWPLALYCALALGLFVAQIAIWDHTAFY